mgnify:CR=1 FL=1
MTSLILEVGPVRLQAELADNSIAAAILNALPISERCQRWGEEIYFPIPVDMANDGGQDVVELGDLAYWPPGKALCIFFGPTPASHGDEPRAASAVTVVGKVVGDLLPLSQVQSGAEIVISKKHA